MYISKNGKKRSYNSRIYLLLMDGEAHQLGEAYEWIAEAVEPNLAIRAFSNRLARDIDYTIEQKIEEGRRARILQTLLHGVKNNLYTVVWPTREPSRHPKSRGYMDIRKCILKLTDVGRDRIINGYGVFASMMSTLYSGIATKRLKMEVTYTGNPRFNDLPPNSDEGEKVQTEKECSETPILMNS